MLVLTFAASGKGNCAEVEGMPYVFARTRLGSFVMPALCSHRGGPLHLGEFNAGGSALVCPWHGGRTSIAKLIRTAVPAVRTEETVTAVFPDPVDARYVITHRPLSAALTCER